jgi:hypothetical protein
MKVIEISVEVGRTASVNFQSARNSVGLTATLEEGEQPSAVIRALQKQAIDLLLGDRDDLFDEEIGATDAESLEAAIRENAHSKEF